MMRAIFATIGVILVTACAQFGAPPAPAAQPTTPPPSLGDILSHSPASDWRALDPENTLYLELASGRVVIELAPHYAPNHAANLRALARAGYFDNSAVTRSQDNYVVQWGRPDGDTHALGSAQATLPAEFQRLTTSGLAFTRAPDVDSYARETGFSDGFPVARENGRTWLIHCYGMVGAGRDQSPDSGGGTELYAVNGHAPRHLDRNVTVLGRVVQGMELLSTLKRGTGDLGFYLTAAERTPIRTIRLAADVPAAQRTNLEALRTDSATFRAVIKSRRFRRDGWFVEPTGHINVCNVPLPVRPIQH